jgi:hypothetical protein
VSVVTCGYETLSVNFRAVHILHVFANCLGIKSVNRVGNLGHNMIRNPLTLSGHLTGYC